MLKWTLFWAILLAYDMHVQTNLKWIYDSPTAVELLTWTFIVTLVGAGFVSTNVGHTGPLCSYWLYVSPAKLIETNNNTQDYYICCSKLYDTTSFMQKIK